MPSAPNRPPSGEIDLVALLVSQQALTTEAQHNAEERRQHEKRLADLESLLTGKEGMFTRLAIIERQQQQQAEILSTLATRAWQLVLAVICEALMVIGLYAWQGIQVRQGMPGHAGQQQEQSGRESRQP